MKRWWRNNGENSKKEFANSNSEVKFCDPENPHSFVEIVRVLVKYPMTNFKYFKRNYSSKYLEFLINNL